MGTRALTAALILLASAALPSAQQPAASKLAQRLAQLQEQQRSAGGGLRGAQTDAERKAAVESMASFSRKLVEIVEESPDDEAALEVLRCAVQAVASTDSGALIAWETNTSEFPSGCADDAAPRIVALLTTHALKSEKLGPVIDRLRYAYRLEFSGLLEKVLNESPQRDVRGAACLSLARFLQDRLRMLRLVDDRPELAGCYQRIFGKAYLPKLQELDRAGLAPRIEALFERAAKDFGDVQLPGEGTVAAGAESELYAIRHLGVGEAAPEIQGTDQDGKPIALGDYRGKVVLLYFWSEY